MAGNNPKRKLGAKRPVPVGSFMMRRVFRQENRYFCGICRTFHDNVEEANHCLETCWKAVLTRAPWTTVKRVGKIAFACIYCQRTFPTSQQATLCAEECASRMTITSLDGRDLAPTKVKHVFAKSNVKPTVNFPFKIGGQHNTFEGSIAPLPEDLNPVASADIPAKELAPQTPDAKPFASPAPATKSDAKASFDRSKKIEREGAKYVCLICHKKYFERVAAEKCFDAHSGGSMDAHHNSGV
jgi:hypothetical protein